MKSLGSGAFFSQLNSSFFLVSFFAGVAGLAVFVATGAAVSTLAFLAAGADSCPVAHVTAVLPVAACSSSVGSTARSRAGRPKQQARQIGRASDLGGIGLRLKAAHARGRSLLLLLCRVVPVCRGRTSKR